MFLRGAWWANACTLVAHRNLINKRPSIAYTSAGAGVVLSAGFLFVKDTELEGMCGRHLVQAREGYVFWVASMVMTFLAAAWKLRQCGENDRMRQNRRMHLSLLAFAVGYVLSGFLIPQGDCSLLP